MDFFNNLFGRPEAVDDPTPTVIVLRPTDGLPLVSERTTTQTTSSRAQGAGLIPLIPTDLTTTTSTTSSALLLPPPSPTTRSVIAVTTTPTPTSATVRPTQVQAPSTPKTEVVTDIVTATIAKSTPTPTPSQNSATADTQTSGSSGPSPVAIGVTVSIAAIVAIAALVFCLRVRAINRRKNKRQTWIAPITTKNQDTDPEAYGSKGSEKGYDRFDDIDINEKNSAVLLPDNISIHNTAGYGAYNAYPNQPQYQYDAAPGYFVPPTSLPAPPPPLHPTGFAPVRAPSPPPSHNFSHPTCTPAPLGVDMNTPSIQINDGYIVPITPFSAVAPVQSSSSVRSYSSVPEGAHFPGAIVTIVRTFTPSLADELLVQLGEQVRLVEKFDDGWASCERMKAGAGVECGFVPVECLGSAAGNESATVVPGMGMTQEKVDNWRLSKRDSSLNPVGRY